MSTTRLLWPHGRCTLDVFLEHLNSRHSNIRITMEVEDKESIPFLDVLVTKTSTRWLTFTWSMQKIDPYGEVPACQFKSSPDSEKRDHQNLSTQSKDIYGSWSLTRGTKPLENSTSANGYKSKDIKRAINLRRTVVTPTTVNEETDSPSTCLPYIHNVTDKIARLLKRKGIKSIFKSTSKIPRELKTQRTNCIQQEYTEFHANAAKTISGWHHGQ